MPPAVSSIILMKAGNKSADETWREGWNRKIEQDRVENEMVWIKNGKLCRSNISDRSLTITTLTAYFSFRFLPRSWRKSITICNSQLELKI